MQAQQQIVIDIVKEPNWKPILTFIGILLSCVVTIIVRRKK